MLPLIETLPVTSKPDSSYCLISIYSTKLDTACIVVADNVVVVIVSSTSKLLTNVVQAALDVILLPIINESLCAA